MFAHLCPSSHSFDLFLLVSFFCPLLLTAPVRTEYGNAIRTTESPSVCGKLNTLSNAPWGLGLQNREGRPGMSEARQNKRAAKNASKVLVVCPEVLAAWVFWFQWVGWRCQSIKCPHTEHTDSLLCIRFIVKTTQGNGLNILCFFYLICFF